MKGRGVLVGGRGGGGEVIVCACWPEPSPLICCGGSGLSKNSSPEMESWSLAAEREQEGGVTLSLFH